jgi:hypothetical protein
MTTVSDGDQDFRTVARLRIGIGIIGIGLPIAIAIGVVATTKGALADSFPDSMSGSYFTHMRNVFVGSMCAIGVFLIGYRRSVVDNRMSTLAGIFALLVAMFPTSHAGDGTADHWQPRLHTAAAVALLILLGLFCVWRFPMGDARRQFLAKATSDRIYVGCGIGMALFGGLELLDQFTGIGWSGLITPTYVSESGAVLLFGVAWLLKGLNLDRALANNTVPLAPPAAPMPAPTVPAPAAPAETPAPEGV